MSTIAVQNSNSDVLIRLCRNENPLGPSKKVIEAIRAHSEDVHLYVDNEQVALYKRIADMNQLPHDEGFSHPVSPSEKLWVTVGYGAGQLLHAIAVVTQSGGGAEAIEAHPSYEMVSRYGGIYFGATAVKVPLTSDYREDLNGMLKKITERTKVLVVVNPNSPTGTVHTGAEIEQFLARVPGHVVVVLDEAYINFAPREKCGNGALLVHKFANLVVVRTLSKEYALAGLRVGYALGQPALIRRIRSCQGGMLPSLSFYAAMAALSDEAHLAKTREICSRSRSIYYRACKELGLTYVSSEAPFVLINVGQDASKVATELGKRGIKVEDAQKRWGLRNCLRVSTGTEEQSEIFVSRLRDILDGRF
ncbi:MAG: histidinol-phosphate transaminase [Opitutaceae bacterium]|jgi:histidinol-phosphate aminotransferase